MHPSTLNLPEMEKIGIPRKISSISLYEQANLAFSQDSILPSMSRFINSINNMSHVVMIPSKLHDFECEDGGDLNDAKSVASDEGSTLSSSSSVSSNLINLANSNPDNLSSTGQTSLYDSYRMLIQAKDDLLWGFKDQKLMDKSKEIDQNNNNINKDDEDNKENKKDEDIVDNQIINQFRSNIQQLNTLLNNFSEMAEYIQDKYKTVYEN